MRRTARMLTRYNAWANTLAFDAVGRLPEGEAMRPRTSPFRNIVHTRNHNYVIDRIFQAHLEGREHGYTARNTAQHLPLEELCSLQAVLDDWYIQWSDRASDAELDERIAFTFVGGGQGLMSRAEMIVHVVNHTTYHRGFVSDLFYQIPVRPPTTDPPVFLRDVPLNLE